MDVRYLSDKEMQEIYAEERIVDEAREAREREISQNETADFILQAAKSIGTESGLLNQWIPEKDVKFFYSTESGKLLCYISGKFMEYVGDGKYVPHNPTNTATGVEVEKEKGEDLKVMAEEIPLLPLSRSREKDTLPTKHIPLDPADLPTGRQKILVAISLIGSVTLAFVLGLFLAPLDSFDLNDALLPTVASGCWTMVMFPLLCYVFSISDSLLLTFVNGIGLILYLVYMVSAPEDSGSEELVWKIILEVLIVSVMHTLLVWLSYMFAYWSGLCSSGRSIQYAAAAAAVGFAINDVTCVKMNEISGLGEWQLTRIVKLRIFLDFIPSLCVNLWAAFIGSAYIVKIAATCEGISTWYNRLGSFIVPYLILCVFNGASRLLACWIQPLLGLILCIHSVLLQRSIEK